MPPIHNCSENLINNVLKLSSETLVILKNFDWPGNVRQLKYLLEWFNIMYGKQKNFKMTLYVI